MTAQSKDYGRPSSAAAHTTLSSNFTYFFADFLRCQCASIRTFPATTCTMKDLKSPHLGNIPNGLAAAGLSNVGFAVFWYNLGRFNHFLPSVVWIICLHAMLGVFMQGVFVLRALWFPKETVRDLLSHPSNVTVIGAISIATALVGQLLSNFESMGLPHIDIKLSTAIVIFATVMSLSSISIFIPLCIQSRTYPEPFFCVVLYSILFMVVSYPGNNALVNHTKAALFGVGLALAPAMLVMMVRVVRPRGREQDVVANNPSVCILQAGPGILCSTWLANPLLGDAASGAGAVISHCLFALSTLSFLCVLLCLYQRRRALHLLGIHPQWVPLSFPFINSATAAGLYRSMFPSSYVTAWCFFLSGIAIINHTMVNVMFLTSGLFMCDSFGLARPGGRGSEVLQDDEAGIGADEAMRCANESGAAFDVTSALYASCASSSSSCEEEAHSPVLEMASRQLGP